MGGQHLLRRLAARAVRDGVRRPDRQPAAAARGRRRADLAELESKGVTFFGDTLDTGVCHMAIFADPDGNHLMLHHRYAPYGDA